ncbi:MAG: SpoIIE family protein phosphatase, partial [Bacteroidales bacterium]|nr:SpoIIE family protein phosphatase [Bacteroidales bacterium]
LEDLREFIKNIFDNTEAQNNGMDIAFCSINFETNIIHYSGANISLFLVRKGEITEYKSTKNPAGSFIAEYAFSDYEIQLEKNDLIYLFSDGYADQFGEVEDKRFKKSKLKKLLLSNASKPIQEQKRILEEVFDNWKLNEDQTDDVLVFGLEI